MNEREEFMFYLVIVDTYEINCRHKPIGIHIAEKGFDPTLSWSQVWKKKVKQTR